MAVNWKEAEPDFWKARWQRHDFTVDFEKGSWRFHFVNDAGTVPGNEGSIFFDQYRFPTADEAKVAAIKCFNLLGEIGEFDYWYGINYPSNADSDEEDFDEED